MYPIFSIIRNKASFLLALRQRMGFGRGRPGDGGGDEFRSLNKNKVPCPKESKTRAVIKKTSG